MTEVLVACPARYVTGGTESLHQLCEALKSNWVDAKMWYWGNPEGNPVAKEFDMYGCQYVTEFPRDFSGTVIFPEIWANEVCRPQYKNCRKAVWWLGVDAYFSHTRQGEWFKFQEQEVIHIAQNGYVKSFLDDLGAASFPLTCYLNDAFFDTPQRVRAEHRENIVLYNPAKDVGFIRYIMDALPDVEFKPIKGMTMQEVISTMDRAKIFVDFGNFPGRERMPREAAVRGCVVIVGKCGTAARRQDFNFNNQYKIERACGSIPRIRKLIRTVLKDGNFEKFQKDFDKFREGQREDRDMFVNRVAGLLPALMKESEEKNVRE